MSDFAKGINVPANDCISRQAAIDALESIGSLDTNADREYARSVFETLPSAQPEPIKVNIDHELTQEEIKNLKQKIADSPIVLLPSAQPEIIYCRDCKYFELNHFEKVDEFPIPIIVAHEICMKWSGGCRTSIDGWCFMAERRTDETD